MTRSWLVDDRTPVRRLQAAWHPDRGLVVLSLWQGDRCTGTFRLPIADAGQLVRFLVDAMDAAIPGERAASRSA